MSAHDHKTTANEQLAGITLTKGQNPSNTHAIQREFIREIQRRLKQIRGLIRKTIGYKNDALHLKQQTQPSSLQVNAEPKESFDFPTEQGRIRAFMRVLRGWLREEVLGTVDTSKIQDGEHWTGKYLRNAYVTGVQLAEGRLMQEGVSITASEREAILDRPISIRQLQDIYTRAYSNLKDITDDMAGVIRRELTEGIREGENPRKVASRINREIQDITHTRAVTLARTETMRSHADATLRTYEQAGVDVVNHTSRLTAQDQRVCPFCRALEGIPFTLTEFASGTVQWGTQTMRLGIPAHPNGRCSPMPEVGLDGDELEPLEDRVPDSIRGKPVTVIGV